MEALEIWKRLRSEWDSGGTDLSKWIVEVADERGLVLARMPISLKFWRVGESALFTSANCVHSYP